MIKIATHEQNNHLYFHRVHYDRQYSVVTRPVTHTAALCSFDGYRKQWNCTCNSVLIELIHYCDCKVH